MKCQKCNQDTLLPFTCPYCGGQFCSEHRLPERHSCPNINSARTQRQAEVITPQSYNSYQYSYNFGQTKRIRRITTSPKELKHIGVAAALVIGIGFSIALYGFSWAWDVIAVFAVIMTASFLTHEIAHKITAQKKGLWAEFRLTTWGAVLTFICVFLPFKMISPGAMMISGSLPKADDIVEISLAGPITNIVLSSTLLGLAFAAPSNAYFTMLFFAAYINAFMAVFNLVPFGILDGYKIFSFNKKLWAIAFVPSAILAVFTYFSVFPLT